MPKTPDPPDGARKASSPRLFMKQANMLRMIHCLSAVAVCGVYFFGWRAAGLVAVSVGTGLVTEWITSRARKQPVSTACFVTCLLFSLSLPPTCPFWIAGVGTVVAILFGKEVFGGFGRNFANPAIVGRAFVYICFPVDLTGRFVPAFRAFPGGFAHWSLAGLGQLPGWLAGSGRSVADAVTQASPMWVAREYGIEVAGQTARWPNLLLGNLGGLFHAPGEAPRIMAAGSIGEGCSLLILACAVYLLWTKTANWRLMAGGLAGLVFTNVLLRNVLGFDGLGGVPPVYFQFLAGTTVYVLVFMITDPVSAPRRRPAQWAYALLIGCLIVTLRWRGVFVAAATFSVLLGNLVGPLLDLAAEALAARRKAKAAAAKGDGP